MIANNRMNLLHYEFHGWSNHIFVLFSLIADYRDFLTVLNVGVVIVLELNKNRNTDKSLK